MHAQAARVTIKISDRAKMDPTLSEREVTISGLHAGVKLAEVGARGKAPPRACYAPPPSPILRCRASCTRGHTPQPSGVLCVLWWCLQAMVAGKLCQSARTRARDDGQSMGVFVEGQH